MAGGLCTVPMPAPQPALGGLAARAQLHPGKWGCCFKAALFLLHPLKACGLSWQPLMKSVEVLLF